MPAEVAGSDAQIARHKPNMAAEARLSMAPVTSPTLRLRRA